MQAIRFSSVVYSTPLHMQLHEHTLLWSLHAHAMHWPGPWRTAGSSDVANGTASCMMRDADNQMFTIFRINDGDSQIVITILAYSLRTLRSEAGTDNNNASKTPLED